jgi:hypothetical protein
MLTLSPEVSHAHTLSISPSLFYYYLRLFSLISVTNTISLTCIRTHGLHWPPLYTYLCLGVSRTHTLFSPLSHALSPPLLLVDRYDSIRSFGRISLTVKLDGNKRQRFSQVWALAIEEIPYSWSCIF